MYEYSYVSYINNKMKADELSIKAGFSIKFCLQIGANEALTVIDKALIWKIFDLILMAKTQISITKLSEK